jgi:hypothetical protein
MRKSDASSTSTLTKRSELASLIIELESLKLENNHLQGELKLITSSRSWRYTHGLRKLVAGISFIFAKTRSIFTFKIAKISPDISRVLVLPVVLFVSIPWRFLHLKFYSISTQSRGYEPEVEGYPFFNSIAVVYLARITSNEDEQAARKFVSSYVMNSSGLNHNLVVIFKGIEKKSLNKVREIFSNLDYQPIYLNDNSLDIGAYIEVSSLISEDIIVYLNTNSEILVANWLNMIVRNFSKPNVGLVGCTGSFESLSLFSAQFPRFPNAHVRTNAFAISRNLFREVTSNLSIQSKMDAWLFESGENSLTCKIRNMGLICMIAGRNGKGYDTASWGKSGVFRSLNQENLIIADNQTRAYASASVINQLKMTVNTWKTK